MNGMGTNIHITGCIRINNMNTFLIGSIYIFWKFDNHYPITIIFSINIVDIFVIYIYFVILSPVHQ